MAYLETMMLRSTTCVLPRFTPALPRYSSMKARSDDWLQCDAGPR